MIIWVTSKGGGEYQSEPTIHPSRYAIYNVHIGLRAQKE